MAWKETPRFQRKKGKQESGVEPPQSLHEDVLPVIFSVHGSLAPAAQAIITRCAEEITGGKEARNYGRTVARLRARIQASVVRSVALCLLCRTPADDPAEIEKKKKKKQYAGLSEQRRLQRYDVHWHLS